MVLPIPPGTHWSEVMPIVLPRETLPVTSGQLPVKGGKKKQTGETPMLQPPTSMRRQFGPPSAKPLPESTSQPEPEVKQPKPKKLKQKNDPKLIAAARELRDRWLEQVNAGQYLPGPTGKYDVSKTLSSTLSEVEGGVVKGSKALAAPTPTHAPTELPALRIQMAA